MLDFQKLSKEFGSLASDLQKRHRQMATERTSALSTLQANQALSATVALPVVPSTYTIISTDGSQIDLERHQSIPCYVINIGTVVITYGEKPNAQLNTEAHVFYRDEDIFVGSGHRRRMVQVADIAARRDIQEAVLAASLTIEYSKDAVVMLDGTLIRWTIENFDEATKKRLLSEYLSALDTCRRQGVPVSSYISYSGSQDFIAALGIKSQLLTDAELLREVLKEGERSIVLHSESNILREYGQHAVSFFYLHVGSEVVRVEVPAWVSSDDTSVDRVHAIAYDQARRGKGYPVALLEAHEQAVVTAADRETFYMLIEQELAHLKPKVRISEKALSKRIRLV